MRAPPGYRSSIELRFGRRNRAAPLLPRGRATPHLGALLVPRSISTSRTPKPHPRRAQHAGRNAPSSDPRRCAALPLLLGTFRGHMRRTAVARGHAAGARGVKSSSHPPAQGCRATGGNKARGSLWGRARKQLDSAARTVSDTRWRARGAPRLVASPRSPPPAARRANLCTRCRQHEGWRRTVREVSRSSSSAGTGAGPINSYAGEPSTPSQFTAAHLRKKVGHLALSSHRTSQLSGRNLASRFQQWFLVCW